MITFAVKKVLNSMYEKKIPFDLNCDIKITMEIISGKWKCCIISRLHERPMRPSEIHREFPSATPRVLNQQLKELEYHRIINKKIYPTLPPHSEYSLTPAGESLLPIIEMLRKWGDGYRDEFKDILGVKE